MTKDKGPIKWFKQRAKELCRAEDIPHMVALHKIACAVGFISWAELIAADAERLDEALRHAKERGQNFARKQVYST